LYTTSATAARYSAVFPLSRSIRANGMIISWFSADLGWKDVR
jgi:hypothetical protein